MPNYFAPEGSSLRFPDKLYINGAWVLPSSQETLTVVSPSDEGVVARVAAAVEDDINKAVTAARDAFDRGPWPQMSVAERAAGLRRMGQGLHKRAGDFARFWTWQSGVPITITEARLAQPNMAFDYYADLIEQKPLIEACKREAGGVAIIAREPAGVVAAIAPFNYPYHLMAMKVAAALAAGCTVIAKPSGETPLDVFLMAECADEAGLPPGVFNIAPADKGPSDALVRHAGVDMVAFTGSTPVGKHIASVCGARMARSFTELGGKSAAIVLDDADFDAIMPGLVGMATFLTGQGCALLTRVLVSERRHDELVDRYTTALRAIRVGDAFDRQTQMGPLAMRRQLDRVTGYIAKGKAEGAKIATGGGRPKGLDRGYFIEPTLFTGVDNSMIIAREEIFGPVVSMIRYKTEEEAVRIADDSVFGLNGAVYTRDAEKAYAMCRRVRAGNMSHNGPFHDSKFPFGGYRDSGMGREGGEVGLHLYTEIKTIYMAEPPKSLT